MAPNIFGERVKELRRELRLTQAELAKRIRKEPGVKADVTYISKIENGKLDAPPSETLIRALAKVLHTNAEDLLDLAGKFDTRALQQLVNQTPEAGILLRRLQSGDLTPEQIRKIVNSK